MLIEIKNRFTNSVLFSHDVEENTLKISLLAALKAGADLHGANLHGANLHGADLRGADLRGADLRGADLDGANLYGANLDGADLHGADLHGANLRGANLRGADLRGADLDGANLRGADLRGANLYGEKISQNPISIVGLNWAVLISDGFMRIGCQRHSHQEWSDFDDAQISDMASDALGFWQQWKQPLLAMCSAHAAKVTKPEIEQAA